MRLTSLLLPLLLAARVAPACQCGDRPGPLDALTRSTAVFDGTVVRRTPFLASFRGFPTVLERNEFLVHQAWRGSNVARLVIVTGFSNCDFLFDVGTRYVVFARPTHGADLGLASSICLPTAAFHRSGRAISDLGPGLAFQPPSAFPAESTLTRAGRVARSSFLWGLVSVAGLFDATFPIASRLRLRFLLGPFVGLSFLAGSLLLAWRRRFRLLAVAAPLLLLLTLLSIALQGYIVICAEPMLSYWILERSHGA